ncbi:MAG: carbohydrate ABC transporter permease [Tepidisphaeraceae bacterium]
MPVISKVGQRSWKVRLIFAVMFLVLGVGSVTMIYPLALMLAGATRGETDFDQMSPLPAYLLDDAELWTKFVQSKYQHVGTTGAAHRTQLNTWKNIAVPANVDAQAGELFRKFRAETPWPREWFGLGHYEASRVQALHGRGFRWAIQDRFKTLDAFSDAVGVQHHTWSQIHVPGQNLIDRRFSFPETPNFKVYYDYKASVPPSDWIVINIDGLFVRQYLVTKWSKIEQYNAAHGTTYASYSDVQLSTAPPSPEQKQQCQDWAKYVREWLNLAYIRIDPSVAPALREFLAKRYLDKIANLNDAWKTSYAGFDAVEIPQGIPSSDAAQSDLGAFLKDEKLCPLESLSIAGPRQAFEQFVARQRGVDVARVAPLPLPIEAADWLDFQEQKGRWKWEFLTRNFKAVLNYILLQGNGIRNTIIYCALVIATNLLVNPIAAYALSRYRPPSTYTILLFCMTTMAFPPEVTMIPSFLLLKRFPLVSLLAGMAVAVAATWLIHKFWPRGSELLKGIFGVGIGIVAGYWVVPAVVSAISGREDTSVSLLNTFWALVLPGMANGFSIFLLKGFFDSLPKELYEAADIDGANEWTKFWMITMSLSKPILAVIALGAFTVAYSEFLMALVIIPDQSMWTLMVWLYQLQRYSHPTVVYASLVIAAIPTFLIFVFCQNIIMRGLVVPTEK